MYFLFSLKGFYAVKFITSFYKLQFYLNSILKQLQVEEGIIIEYFWINFKTMAFHFLRKRLRLDCCHLYKINF